MIKSLIQLSFTLFFFSFQNRLISQCSPDPTLSYPDGWGVIPDDGTILPVQYVNEPYDYTLYFRAPTTAQQVVDAGYFSSCWPACGQDVDQIRIVTISGMPPGLSEICNTPNCTWYTSEDGCANVTGTPTLVGFYTIEILLEGEVTVLGFTESRDYTMTFYQPIEERPCELTASVQGTNETSINSYDGSATVTASNGDGPYSFEWSNGSTQNQIIGLTAGTYQVTATDTRGCEAYNQVTIETDNTTVDPCIGYGLHLQTSNESYTGSMDGSVEAIVSNGQAPFLYSWTNNSSSNPNQNLSTGAYSVTVIDANGCTESAGTIVQLDSVVPPPDTNTTDTTVTDTTVSDTTVLTNPCLNFSLSLLGVNNESELGAMDGSATANVLNGTEPINYTWSNGANNATNNNLSAGNYWVYVQDSLGCSALDTVSLVLDDSTALFCNLYLNFIKSDESASGANDGNASASALNGVGPYQYAWGNGTNTQYLSNLSPGIYSITATDNTGCQTIDSVRIFPYGDNTCNLNVSVIANPESFEGASDGVASALVNGGSPPYEYVWSNGEFSGTIYELGTNNYTVTITDANLCQVSVLATVSVGPISVNELSESPKDLFYFYPNPTNQNITLSIDASVNLENASIQIFDVTGSRVKQMILQKDQHNQLLELDPAVFSSGAYLLQFNSDQFQTSKKLFVR